MNIQQAYNEWAEGYDQAENKTRDLEKKALQHHLHNLRFHHALEAGCGTGKNTPFLSSISTKLTAADFSEQMMAKAKAKNNQQKIEFVQTDFTNRWPFAGGSFNLVSFSLVLEHIENLSAVFAEASRVLKNDGLLYIGELHPFKQYSGTKARFDNGNGIFELECFVHHISDFLNAAEKNNFRLLQLKEWFDEENRDLPPRIISMLFKKENS